MLIARTVVRIKRCPADWRVSERLPGELVEQIRRGEGEHLYICVEKRGLNSEDVVRRLMDCFSVPHVAIGYAGRKDKHAHTTQWFSVHTEADAGGLDTDALEHDGITLLDAGRGPKKLRRGEHELNCFEIILRDVEQTDGACWDNLARPFPNYFGPQRFGTSNVDEAIDWVLHRRERKVARERAGWFLSVLRSYLFNKILDARLAVAGVTAVIDGDLVENGVATAPLWGRGRSQSAGRALEIESDALGDLADVCEALEYAGVSQARRAVWVTPRELTLEPGVNATDFSLAFALPPSAYATVMLAQTFQVVDESR